MYLISLHYFLSFELLFGWYFFKQPLAEGLCHLWHFPSSLRPLKYVLFIYLFVSGFPLDLFRSWCDLTLTCFDPSWTCHSCPKSLELGLSFSFLFFTFSNWFIVAKLEDLNRCSRTNAVLQMPNPCLLEGNLTNLFLGICGILRQWATWVPFSPKKVEAIIRLVIIGQFSFFCFQLGANTCKHS